MIEAEVKVNNGRASDISNGHVYRADDEKGGIEDIGAKTALLADFSNYSGASHRTWYGDIDLEGQIALTKAIETFCSEVGAGEYVAGIMNYE